MYALRLVLYSLGLVFVVLAMAIPLVSIGYGRFFGAPIDHESLVIISVIFGLLLGPLIASSFAADHHHHRATITVSLLVILGCLIFFTVDWFILFWEP